MRDTRVAACCIATYAEQAFHTGMSAMQTALQLLHTTQSILRANRVARTRDTDRLPPQFRPLELFRVDEYTLSQLIACLLDPQGMHGQGSRFLEAFIRHFRLDALALDVTHSRVVTEQSTRYIEQNRRRLDILVDDGQAGFAIENKPWAGDQPRQCADYLADLGRRFQRTGRYCLLYLSPDGRDPDESSLPATQRDSPHFATHDLSELRAWLEDCRDLCRADAVRHFIDAIASYFRHQFEAVTDMSDIEQIVSEGLRDPEHVEAFLTIATAQYELQRRLRLRLQLQLETLIAQTPTLNGFDLVSSPNTPFQWHNEFVIDWKPETRLYVTIAAEEAHWPQQGWIYGVRRRQDGILSEQQHNKKVKQLQSALGHAESNHWWLWFQAFEFDDWKKNPAMPWIGIADGHTTSQRIVDTWLKVIVPLREQGRLDLLH